MLPCIFFKKKWCNSVHSRAHFSLQNFAVFELLFFVLPLQRSLKYKEKKKNLKCDLMVLTAALTSDGTILIPFWLQRKKKFQLDLSYGHMSTAV